MNMCVRACEHSILGGQKILWDSVVLELQVVINVPDVGAGKCMHLSHLQRQYTILTTMQFLLYIVQMYRR